MARFRALEEIQANEECRGATNYVHRGDKESSFRCSGCSATGALPSLSEPVLELLNCRAIHHTWT